MRNHSTGRPVMAKATTAKGPKKVKKSGRSAAKSGKATAKAGPDTRKKGGKSKARDAADALWKLADHPLVGELLAVGATAAVVALAEGGLSGKKKASTRAVKGGRRRAPIGRTPRRRDPRRTPRRPCAAVTCRRDRRRTPASLALRPLSRSRRRNFRAAIPFRAFEPYVSGMRRWPRSRRRSC